MTDSSTTTASIVDLIAEDCWAGRQLRSGIKDFSVASKPMILLTLMGVAQVGEAGLRPCMFMRTIEAFL